MITQPYIILVCWNSVYVISVTVLFSRFCWVTHSKNTFHTHTTVKMWISMVSQIRLQAYFLSLPTRSIALINNMTTNNNPIVVVVTVDQMLYQGLQLVGFNCQRVKNVSCTINLDQFCAHFGSNPIELSTPKFGKIHKPHNVVKQ